jgi:hypothetical protein
MKLKKSDFSRREFLSTVTATAGLLALGLTPDASAAEILRGERRHRKRVGISDAAFRAAWKRAKKLVDQMTLEEKVGQLGSRLDNAPGAETVRRLNLPAYSYYTGEALHGLLRSAPVTTFPVPLALAATWNSELILGEKKTVAFELRYSEQAFWYWDEKAERFVTQPGTARILVGNSSANILLTGELTLAAS